MVDLRDGAIWWWCIVRGCSVARCAGIVRKCRGDGERHLGSEDFPTSRETAVRCAHLPCGQQGEFAPSPSKSWRSHTSSWDVSRTSKSPRPTGAVQGPQSTAGKCKQDICIRIDAISPRCTVAVHAVSAEIDRLDRCAAWNCGRSDTAMRVINHQLSCSSKGSIRTDNESLLAPPIAVCACETSSTHALKSSISCPSISKKVSYRIPLFLSPPSSPSSNNLAPVNTLPYPSNSLLQ